MKERNQVHSTMFKNDSIRKVIHSTNVNGCQVSTMHEASARSEALKEKRVRSPPSGSLHSIGGEKDDKQRKY